MMRWGEQVQSLFNKATTVEIKMKAQIWEMSKRTDYWNWTTDWILWWTLLVISPSIFLPSISLLEKPQTHGLRHLLSVRSTGWKPTSQQGRLLLRPVRENLLQASLLASVCNSWACHYSNLRLYHQCSIPLVSLCLHIRTSSHLGLGT